MKRWKTVVLLLFWLLLFGPAAVYGSEKAAITMEVEYGFKGNVKMGSCFPVRVTVENPGEPMDDVTLLLKVPLRTDNGNIYSSIWMNGMNQGGNRDRIYTYRKKISLQKGEKKTETFYLELPMFEGTVQIYAQTDGEILAETELNCSFVENSSRILIGVVAENPEGITELDGTRVNMENGDVPEAFVKMIPLEPEEIYPNPKALKQLDLLIADKTTEFSEEQQVALSRWKNSGGFYLEREDENLSDLFRRFQNGEQREKFLRHLKEMQIYRFGETAGLDQVPVSKRPSMGTYLFLLGIYIAAVGPGIFIFLKKKKKQRYLWRGICLLSLLFMTIIAILGRKTSIHAPFISYSGLYEQQEDVWSENVKIGIQAPFNAEYQLYLDNSYSLLPMGVSASESKVSRPESAEQINIRLGEEDNKITIGNMAVYTQNLFELERNKRISGGEVIQVNLSGDGENLEGSWKNPTGYDIKNAILVMRNRTAILGDLDAGSAGEISRCSLYSCGNEGLKVLMNQKTDFSEFEYPKYELEKLNSQAWSILRNASPDQAYLLGIVKNPDMDFQENSGYSVFGSALIQIPLRVSWEKNGYLWCPNLEGYGENLNGEYSSETNLMYGKVATVDYPVDFLGDIQELTLFPVEFDEEKYYFSFQGHVAFYIWESGEYEEIHDWNRTLPGEKLKKYLSERGVIRARYILDDTLDTRERACMLPCLQAVGKVE